MHKQTDRWMDGSADMWTKRQMKGRTFEQMNRQADVRIVGCTDRQMHGRKCRNEDKETDERTDI